MPPVVLDRSQSRTAGPGSDPGVGRPIRGFTLVELIVTIAIAGVLLATALPSLGLFTGGSAVSATVNDVVFALQSARSEAIKRAAPVVLCPSQTSLDGDPRCGGGYADGWIVYAETGSDGVRDANEELLLRGEPRTDAFTVSTPGNTFASRVLFDATGASTSPTGIPLSGTIRIVHTPTAETRDVSIRVNGRVDSAVVVAGP